MERYIEKAKVLVEALPYIRRFYGKRVVIKMGGRAMADDRLKRSFATDVILLKTIGMHPIVVHGGGPQIGEVLKKMGKESSFYQGMRITDDETMDVVEMVLVGKVNKEIVGLITREGGKAVGLSGKDGNLIVARKIDPANLLGPGEEPEIIDLGNVGEVEQINPDILKPLEEERFIPVIAPVGVGPEGASYNINADLVASAMAFALEAEKLVLLTDVDGVLDPDGNLISTLDVRKAAMAIREGIIKGGMIPKVNCCIQAVELGVRKAHIIDGRKEHAVLVEIFTDLGIGTEITPVVTNSDQGAEK
jgi:acetylglutamate kinase